MAGDVVDPSGWEEIQRQATTSIRADGRRWQGLGALQMRSGGGGRGGAVISGAFNEWRR
jgi:hypothetical protein